MRQRWKRHAQRGLVAAIGVTMALGAVAAEDRSRQRELRALQIQNESLQQQIRKQQQLIEKLSGRVEALEQGNNPSESAPNGLIAAPKAALNKINITGEAAVAIFHSEALGPAPNAEFRVDEAKLFIEAPLWTDVYFFSEINITTREDPNIYLQPGELYVDFENVSRLWNRDRQVNIRVGRLDIPFGEEYLTRDAIDNPLISHSVSDIWGVDEGIAVYGSLARIEYVLAVQNGGHPALRDYNEDKSITLRLGYDPFKWLHVSGSAMRTGALDVRGDKFSELWFGNDFVRSLAPASTTRFEANVAEVDVHARWGTGHFKAAGGYLKYDDDDPTTSNQRNVYYYFVEGLQHITKSVYAAARWSQAVASDGFTLVGDGDPSEYSLNTLTRNLSRLSLGVGLRWSPNFLIKAEYTFNHGKTLGGAERSHENIAAGQMAFRF